MSISFTTLANELKREYHRKLDGEYGDDTFGRMLLEEAVERNINDLENFELLSELSRIEEKLLKEKNASIDLK